MSNKIQIGLTVLGALLLLYLLLAWGSSSGFWAEEQQRLTIVFDNVDGLLEGDPVDVRGYRSGKVLAIRPAAEGVFVDISLDKAIQLQEDAVASLQVRELMGGKQVSLFPGTSATSLSPEATIPGTKELDFSSAFSKLGDGLEELDFERLNQTFYRLDTLSQKLIGLASAVPPEELSQLSGSLAQTTRSLNYFVNQLNKNDLPNKLDSTLSQFSHLAGTADSALRRFDHLAASMQERTLPQADTLMNKLGDFLTKTEQSLEAANALFAQLKDTSTVAGKLLYDPAWATLVDSSLYNLNKTLVHIRKHKVHVALSLSPKKKTYED
ncbi:MAG: MlaD family protein [Bacteroidia bacterium]